MLLTLKVPSPIGKTCVNNAKWLVPAIIVSHESAIRREGRGKQPASNLSECERDVFTLEMLRSQINFFFSMRLVIDKGEEMEK